MKNAKIRNLLSENRTELLNADKVLNNTGICYDGIVNENEYEKSGKIVFLLKETNGCDSTGTISESLNDWDYRSWLEYQQYGNAETPSFGQKALYRTFYNIGMWLQTFETDSICENFEEFVQNGGMDEAALRKALGKTAIINLKKTWGGSSTRWKDLKDYLENEKVREIIRQEISIIEPKIVLCGGLQVYDFAKEIFPAEKEFSLSVASKTVSCFLNNDVLFVEFYHPSCRKSREYLFDFSKEIVENLRNNT